MKTKPSKALFSSVEAEPRLRYVVNRHFMWIHTGQRNRAMFPGPLSTMASKRSDEQGTGGSGYPAQKQVYLDPPSQPLFWAARDGISDIPDCCAKLTRCRSTKPLTTPLQSPSPAANWQLRLCLVPSTIALSFSAISLSHHETLDSLWMSWIFQSCIEIYYHKLKMKYESCKWSVNELEYQVSSFLLGLEIVTAHFRSSKPGDDIFFSGCTAKSVHWWFHELYEPWH